MEFESVEATGSAPSLGLSPEAVAAMRELNLPAAEPVEFSPASGWLTPALAALRPSNPTALLPGWEWPMASGDEPTPIYEQLINDMPDPRDAAPAEPTPDED